MRFPKIVYYYVIHSLAKLWITAMNLKNQKFVYCVRTSNKF